MTLDTRAERYYLNYGKLPTLDDTLPVFPHDIEYDNIPIPKKLSLIASEVPKLLGLLWFEGISKAHLMPTLDNVAQTLALQMKYAPLSNTPDLDDK